MMTAVANALSGRIWVTIIAVCLLVSTTDVFGAVQFHDRQRACVQWAASQLSDVLRGAGIPVDDAVIIVEKRHNGFDSNEAFTLSIEGNQVTIAGAGASGEMYGLLELAEQIANSPARRSWGEVVATLSPTRQTPYLAFRADNSFIHNERTGLLRLAERLHLIHPAVLFDDLKMWERYVDMLAANRFNVLDLHGGYRLADTRFFNILPSLLTVPSYSGAGNAKVQQRNLSDLRHIIRYAKKRGVAVGLMNYSAKVDGVPQTSISDYTQKAVVELIRQLPDLHLFGFRAGESGEDMAFFKKTYITPLRTSERRNLRFYTRNWKTTPEENDEAAALLGDRLDVEVKYNGEHLGLPYQAILGPAHSDYSYGDFLKPNAHYGIIWQARANGTHRFWTWAQTEFIRRAVRSFRFGGAVGFSLEGPTAYYSRDPAIYYSREEDRAVYEAIWEKHWPWYFAWGRLSFNPDLPSATFIAVFTRRYGPFGKEIYDALQASGSIVPLATSYRFPGPDQRNMSPETQTGAFDPVRKEPIDVVSFARNTPMDSSSFVGIDEFIHSKLAHKVEPRIGPPHLAQLFSAAAAAARGHIDRVGPLSGKRAGEWRLMKADILGASYLGDYYAARILGTMHFDYALKAHSSIDYDLAREYLAQSRDAWAHLGQTCDSIYSPLNDPLLEQEKYTWGSQTSRLKLLDESISLLWAKSRNETHGEQLELTAQDWGKEIGLRLESLSSTQEPGEMVRVTCRLTEPARSMNVVLWTKKLASTERWIPRPMQKSAIQDFVTTLHNEPDGLLYFVQATDENGSSTHFPNPLEETPYRFIPGSQWTKQTE